MNDTTPKYNVAEFSLRHWGRDFRNNSKLTDIGYPKQCSFMNDPTGRGFHTDVEPDDNSILIEKILKVQPVLYLVAQCSYAFHSKESISTKATQLFAVGGVWLGSTSNTQRVTYKSLETQLLAYVEGAFAAMDND